MGAIVSGAYFGDKMSPLSDTTNLAPSVSDAGLFDHVRHMMATTTPTYLICMALYGAIGFSYGGAQADSQQIQTTLQALEGAFLIHPLLLLPPLLVLAMVVFRIPALPRRLGLRVVDATCPFVAKIHRLAEEASQEGRFVLIAGDKNHPRSPSSAGRSACAG